MKEAFCRICGFPYEDNFPWTEIDGKMYPSREICPCCGAEHGFDDDLKSSVIVYRQNWISKGFPFDVKEKQPKDWNEQKLMVQLKNISAEWL
ncbi:hypothetical protein GC194_14980 [bacterium]|nr:hypothetical protein [bacterium]